MANQHNHGLRRSGLQHCKLGVEQLEQRWLLNAAPIASDDVYSTNQDTPLIVDVATTRDAQHNFEESFAGNELPPTLEDPAGTFFVADGVIQTNDPRQYARTVESDFITGDFTYEISFTIAGNQEEIEYIGLGEGQRGSLNEPGGSVHFRIHSLAYEGVVMVTSAGPFDSVVVGQLTTTGPHRARLEKVGNRLTMEIDEGFDGTFEADVSHVVANLTASASFLGETNSRLFFGGSTIATFDDMHLEFESTSVAVAGVLDNDVDADGDSLSTILVDGPANGILSLHPDGTFEYTPNSGFTGNDQFTYRASDADLVSNVATAAIVVNAAPTAVNDVYAIDEDSTLRVSVLNGLLINDTDPEDDDLIVELSVGPQHGGLTLDADGSFIYEPSPDYFGTDSFRYRARDGSIGSNEAMVTITVNPVNDSPVAVDDIYRSTRGTIVTVDAIHGVLANDRDAENDVLTATLLEGPLHGQLTLQPDGAFIYEPHPLAAENDRFRYQAADIRGDTSTATVYIVFGNDFYTTPANTPLDIGPSLGVLANDGPEGQQEPLLIVPPEHGDLELRTDGSFRYVPAADFTGTDQAIYKAVSPVEGFALYTVDTTNDQLLKVDSRSGELSLVGAIGHNMGQVDLVFSQGILYALNRTAGSFELVSLDPRSGSMIAVVPLQHSPTLVTTKGITAVDGQLYVIFADKASYCGDACGAAHILGVLNPDTGFLGQLVNYRNLSGGFRHDWDALATDGDGRIIGHRFAEGFAIQTYVLGIQPPSLTQIGEVYPPRAALDDATVVGSSLFLYSSAAQGIYRFDMDEVGFSAIVELLPVGAPGASLSGLAYAPEFDIDIATITFEVTAPGAPTAMDDAYSLAEDGTLSIAAEQGVLINDTQSAALGAMLTRGPLHGLIDFHDDGSLQYTPVNNFFGTDVFQYRTSDGFASSNVATVTVTVSPSPDAPEAADDEYGAFQGTELLVAIALGVSANDHDPDFDLLSVRLVQDVQNGTLSLAEDGSFTYQPRTEFIGIDQFQYRVSDGQFTSPVATVSIEVQPLPPPLALADSYTIAEDNVLNATQATSASIQVLWNDFESEVAAAWSRTELGRTPTGRRGFLGPFQKENVHLNFTELPIHTDVTVSFDLFVIGSMDGDDELRGPDVWQLYVNRDPNLVVTTFSNTIHFQAYPDSFRAGSHFRATGAVETGTLGYPSGVDYLGDAVYYLSSTFEHQDEMLELVFAGESLQLDDHGDPGDEMWGLDNVRVTVNPTPMETLGLLANDSDPNGLPISASLVRDVEHGRLTLQTDGTFTYVPAEDYVGLDQFTYKLSNGHTESAEATVQIAITPANDVPVGVEDEYVVPRGGTEISSNAATGVLSNDFDADGDDLTAILLTPPENGILTLNADGSFEYLPGPAFELKDTFTYQVNDGLSTSEPTSVTFVLDAPRLSVGEVLLQPNMPGQEVPVFVTGGHAVSGANFFLQIGDGGPELSEYGVPPGTDGPAITRVDLKAGTIFAVVADPQVDQPGIPQVATTAIAISAAGESVTADGLLATVTVDTTGFFAGSWDLLLADVLPFAALSGPFTTDFAGIPAHITNGRLVIRETEVVGRHLFYAGSSFADALATDKQPLFPGETATFANYSSYSRGLNGLAIDVANLLAPPTLDDFEFRVGRNGDLSTWTAAPAPADFSVLAGAGLDGADRVVIRWQVEAIFNQWLEVSMLPSVETGLPHTDVFYFGNAPGDTGDSPTNALVNATDVVRTRDNKKGPFNPPGIDDPYDFNRDGLVNATDVIFARDHITSPFTALQLITPVPAPAAAALRTPRAPLPIRRALAAAIDEDNESLPAETRVIHLVVGAAEDATAPTQQFDRRGLKWIRPRTQRLRTEAQETNIVSALDDLFANDADWIGGAWEK